MKTEFYKRGRKHRTHRSVPSTGNALVTSIPSSAPASSGGASCAAARVRCIASSESAVSACESLLWKEEFPA